MDFLNTSTKYLGFFCVKANSKHTFKKAFSLQQNEHFVHLKSTCFEWESLLCKRTNSRFLLIKLFISNYEIFFFFFFLQFYKGCKTSMLQV